MNAITIQISRPGAPVVTQTYRADELVVGRSNTADIIVADSSVSRRHAKLWRRAGRWHVEDLGSRFGTRLNGNPLLGQDTLRSGDEIRLGETVLRVDQVEGSAPAVAPAVVPAVGTIGDHQTVFTVLKPASELVGIGEPGIHASSRLSLLNDVHRALAAPISREQLLQLILDRAFALLRPDHAAIFLKGPTGDLYQAAERRSPKSTGALLVSRRLADEVAIRGGAALVFDAPLDDRFASESVITSGVRSIVAAPLADADGCLGMIALYSNLHAHRFQEQDLELLVSLASVAAMRVRNIAMAEEAAQRRVIDRELALARDIQMGMLQQRSLGRSEVETAARLVPARLVGGDFYEFQLEADRLWFVIGDVAGKGMAAALMMVMSQTLFRAIAALGLPLDEVMSRLNRELARDNERAMFVTALAGCLDLATGHLVLANAGHNLPYLLRQNGTVDRVTAANGVALGVLEDATFPLTGLRLAAGDALLAYTDGVCDAVDPGGVSFGTDGLERQLRGVVLHRPDAIVSSLFEAVEAHAGDAAQEDDITIVAVRYEGPQTGTRP
ncbi:MAG: SpoIIE family protein phosphatase [Acidobacteriota bacterium]